MKKIIQFSVTLISMFILSDSAFAAIRCQNAFTPRVTRLSENYFPTDVQKIEINKPFEFGYFEKKLIYTHDKEQDRLIISLLLNRMGDTKEIISLPLSKKLADGEAQSEWSTSAIGLYADMFTEKGGYVYLVVTKVKEDWIYNHLTYKVQIIR